MGKVIGTKKVKETTPQEITKMMVGHNVDLSRQEAPYIKGNTVLEVKNLDYINAKNVNKLKNINFSVRGGEILGVAGIDGNGQQELVETICGIKKSNKGEIRYLGADISEKSIRERKDKGIACIPEDRHLQGLILDYSISENLILGQHYLPQFRKGKFVSNSKRIYENAAELKEKFDIRCADVNVAASTLSGGNQQKIIIARETTANPDLLIAVQPTRGLDIGAIEFVHKKLLEQRNAGKAVLLISFELDEILQVSDRIMVLHKGEIVGIIDGSSATREQVGAMMLGLKEG